jgi:predicted DNA-binding transcriptional regulator AlpA
MKMVPPDRLPADKGIDFSNPYRIELENQGKFPKRVKLGERKYAYVEHELDEWLKQRAALRETAAA